MPLHARRVNPELPAQCDELIEPLICERYAISLSARDDRVLNVTWYLDLVRPFCQRHRLHLLYQGFNRIHELLFGYEESWVNDDDQMPNSSLGMKVTIRI